ncbi:retrovirus-related pol polyprotein from transposon TNT 1-94 [Tanacetum coccineum]
MNNELKKQKALLQKELETYKERVKTLEKKLVHFLKYKEAYEELEREIRVEKDTIDRLLKEKYKIQGDFFKLENEKVTIQHETALAKKAFKERENKYLEDIVDLEEKISSHDRIVYKMRQSIQTIRMLGRKPNKVYDPFLKAGLGYQNPKRLKKAIVAQPKMYDGERIHSTKLIIDSPDFEETLKGAEESRLKMKDKIIQLDYEKLNALYDTFVPQQEIPIEHTYFSTPSTSNVSSKSSIKIIQDLLMTISELKEKIKTIEKREGCVASSNSVRRPESEDTNSKKIVLLNTKSKNKSTNVKKVKRALFTSPVGAKSRNLGATSIVAKSRFNVAKTPIATNKVSSASSLSPESSQTCEQGKSKKANFPPKSVPSTKSKLKLIHMDLCGPMSVESINGKRYILVIVDDYSRYTWVFFLRTKDEAPDMIINFINQIQRNMQTQILKVRSDNGTEFKNEKLRQFYEKLGIIHHTSMARAPRQNEFLWGEAIATACFTQNRFIVHTRYNKTPYELIKGRKPNVQYFHVFRSLCYPTNDRDDLGKMTPKADIGIFIGYSETSRGFRIYNRRTRKIMETIHVKFDELTSMAFECNNSGPGFNCSNFQDSSKDTSSIPSKEDLDNFFGPLYEEYYATRSPEVSKNSAANTLYNEDTPSSSLIVVKENEDSQIVTSSEGPVSNEPTTLVSNVNADESIQEDVSSFDRNNFYNPFHTPVFEEAESSSTFPDPSNMHKFHHKHRSTGLSTKNHPIEQVIGDPSKPIMIRRRLDTNVEMCMYALTLSTMEPKNIKQAMLDHSWIGSMQDELNQFKHLDV